MALQLGALRDALIDAGASPETANRAAEELAGHDREFTGLRADMTAGFARVDADMIAGFARVDADMTAGFARVDADMTAGFARVDQEFVKICGDMNQEFAKVHGDINLLRWMAGANFAITLAVFVKLFIH
jgi:hypothetical protein